MQASEPSPEAQADALLLRFLSKESDAESNPWTDALAKRVSERRAQAVGSLLLIDRLLQDAHIAHTLYPPTSPSATFVFLVEVLTSAAEPLAKHAIVYYLGMEHDHALPTLTPNAPALADHLHLPGPARAEVEAYWFVDHGYLDVRTTTQLMQRAIAGGRTAKFAPVMAESLSVSPELLLRFYEVRNSLPTLNGALDASSLHELGLVVVALARVEGLVAAWLVCRAVVAAQPAEHVAEVKSYLFGALLRVCFAPADSTLIRDLMSLPLHADEEAMIESFAIDSLNRAQGAVAMDTLLIKWVNQGRYIDAIHLDRRAAHHERSMAFTEHEHELYARAKQRRHALMEGVWAVLPAIQRDALRTQDAEQEASDKHEEHSDDVDMDKPASPPPRPHTPLSASLSAKDVGRTRLSSPDVNLLRASIRVPTASNSDARSASPVPKVSESAAELRSSSPFSGWKRPGPMPASPMSPKPVWSLPVPPPSRPTKPTEPDDDEQMPIVSHQTADALTSRSKNEALPTDEPMPDRAGDEAQNQDTSDAFQEKPVRRRGAQRRAARQATKALRKALRPDEEAPAPTIPGGFPLEEEKEMTANTSPRQSTRRSTRRARKSTTDGMSASTSMYPDLASKSPRIPRSSSTADVTAYPQNSLARLEALTDSRPIARRTRAQTAELESLGSQASADGSDNEVDDHVSTAATPPRTRRLSRSERPSAVSTPQRMTRSSRRLRDGSTATPGTPSRRR